MIRGKAFLNRLMTWHAGIDRNLPWKKTADPYAIWLSEIILQQTQIAQGIPYYLHFIKTYPTVQDLAAASEEEVMKHWQGLGYNTRARNLHRAACRIVNEHQGKFPNTYKDIRALPGVGDYTAAAISSFAFNLPYPVVDANVVRFLSRLWGISDLRNSTTMKNKLESMLNHLIGMSSPPEFNQAMMDFGAIQCKARSPGCSSCPFRQSCHAYLNKAVDQFPHKPTSRPRKRRYFHFLFISDDTHVLLRQRPEGDIWTAMFDFPLVETVSASTPQLKDINLLPALLPGLSFDNARKSKQYKQVLTHQEIIAWFYEIHLDNLDFEHHDGFRLVNRTNLDNFAFPKLIYCYLQDKSIL